MTTLKEERIALAWDDGLREELELAEKQTLDRAMSRLNSSDSPLSHADAWGTLVAIQALRLLRRRLEGFAEKGTGHTKEERAHRVAAIGGI